MDFHLLNIYAWMRSTQKNALSLSLVYIKNKSERRKMVILKAKIWSLCSFASYLTFFYLAALVWFIQALPLSATVSEYSPNISVWFCFVYTPVSSSI